MNLGSLKIFRIYDVAHEVRLDEAESKLRALGHTSKFQLKKSSKDFLFADVPLVLTLGQSLIKETLCDIQIKVWSYGALSICLTIRCDDIENKKDLISWVKEWSENDDVNSFCKNKISELSNILGKTLEKPFLWDQEEDYSIFVANTSNQKREYWLEENFIYQLLSMEKDIILSEEMISPIKKSSLSYGPNDLVIIDWDNAFVYSQDDSLDICDVIELANVQLLELRYFDNLLDKKLSGLYRQVIEKRPTLFNSTISLLARDASQLYLETSELVERIENSLKVIGDIYFARIYRLSLARLQVPQWQGTVDQKLKNLLEVSQMYMSELHTKRSQYMEAVIIILIAIEVVPFLYSHLLKGLTIIESIK